MAADSVTVSTFEALGTFYLGRQFDHASKQLAADPVLYDSRDLVTHGVIVGMTGSGKTGLGVTLIEEALIDNIPVIAIDPKGDLSNLLLTFPDLAPKDFQPWVDPDEAARKKESVETYAAEQAEAWKNGLAEWGQDGARIAKLKAAAEFVIYTPGSRAGVPISVLKSFAAPPAAERDDEARLAEAVQATATSVLTLIGIDADPVQSREHILLASILGDAWRQGQDLDLAAVIQRVQSPPFSRVGALELEAFYPQKERFTLATRINSLLAAPGFAVWMEGQPLDVAKLLYTPAGKPRCAIVSIAHLGDAERMFFVTLLLNQVVTWMRAQSGTSSLRALLYMDEVAGYMPPVANPPSKQALLLLMKQARAFGLGVVLATQNPVDLDYKGLSNAGTWFLGRLQTERDKARLLDGLEGAMASQSSAFDRAGTDQALSALQKRTFFMHDVHEDGPVIFQTRWALSYLRGPLTEVQIRALREQSPEMSALAAAPAPAAKSAKSAAPTAAAPAAAAPSGEAASPAAAPAAAAAAVSAGASTGAPVLPPGIEQFFVPLRSRAASVSYQACLYATATVHYTDSATGVDTTRTVTRLVPFGTGAQDVDWDNGEDSDVPAADLESTPESPATFGPLPPAAAKAASYAAWLKEYGRWVYQTQTLTLLQDPVTGATSNGTESEADFRARVQHADREQRDADVSALRARYAAQAKKLSDQLQKADDRVKREQGQATSQYLQTAVSFGTTVLGALLGRKTISVTNLGRATTAARGVGRSMKEREDVQRASEGREALQAQIAALDAELQAKLAERDAQTPAPDRKFTTRALKPRKTDVAPQRVVLVWNPSA